MVRPTSDALRDTFMFSNPNDPIMSRCRKALSTIAAAVEALVFFQDFLFEGTRIHADPYGYAIILGTIDHSLDL